MNAGVLRRCRRGARLATTHASATWPDALRPVHRHNEGARELPIGWRSNTIAVALRQAQHRESERPALALWTNTSSRSQRWPCCRLSRTAAVSSGRTDKLPDVNHEERRAANEQAVRGFFARWDPAWRWILILGMRELRANPKTLGALANAEANNDTWSEDSYVYGALSHGITAAAVNEAVQHCEDLFALLWCLRDAQFFARDIASYRAGQVVDFGRGLIDADDDAGSRLFLVPDRTCVRVGLNDAEDPESAIEKVEAGRARLGKLLRETAAFYRRFEDFHLQYKHGLKLPLRPFGEPTEEAIADRKRSVCGYSYTRTSPSKDTRARSTS
jgi:hypothetical protein